MGINKTGQQRFATHVMHGPPGISKQSHVGQSANTNDSSVLHRNGGKAGVRIVHGNAVDVTENIFFVHFFRSI